MKRLDINWMGKYYAVLDGGEKIGEIYYSCGNKAFMYMQEGDMAIDKEALKQIITFIENEDESNKSYT